MPKQQPRSKWPLWKILVLIFVLAVSIASVVVVVIYSASKDPVPKLIVNTITITVAVTGAIGGFIIFIISTGQSADKLSSQVQLLPIPQQSPVPRNIVGKPPPIDSNIIQQRKKAVQEVYERLVQRDITALVLTGICGIGKSILAALVYQEAGDSNLGLDEPFSVPAIWIEVDTTVTLFDLASSICKVLGISSDDFDRLAPREQADQLFNVLDGANPPRLVILDQFDSLLDVQTGHVLAGHSGVAEWLDQINSRLCRSKLLLTSRLWPKGTHEFPPCYMQEYPVGGLEVSEAKELLKQQQVQGLPEDLSKAIETTECHALALTELATILRGRNLSLKLLLDDPVYSKFWLGDIIRDRFHDIFEHLSQVQCKLLVAFSIYRKPVPLQAVQIFKEFTAAIPVAQLRLALDGLLAQHLVQATDQSGIYKVPALVTDYVQCNLLERDELNSLRILRAAHIEAAKYYLDQATQKSDNVYLLVEVFWHLCQARQWRKAYDLLIQKNAFADLERLGDDTTLLNLYQHLLPVRKWTSDSLLEERIYNNLVAVSHRLGKVELEEKYRDLLTNLST